MKYIFVFLIIMFFVTLAAGIYLFLIQTVFGRKKKKRSTAAGPFMNRMIAHRGLFENSTDHPENSAAAFKRAVDKGFAVELDVHLTTDGKLVVFHDRSLKRMCGEDKEIFRCSYDELKKYRLAGSEEKIPLFEDILDIIGNKVPLLMEIKPEGHCIRTAAAAAEMLDRHPEVTYCMESFHPFPVWWFRVHRPEVMRGQLSTDFYKNKVRVNRFIGFIFKNLLFNFLSKPDFIAYNHKYADAFSYRLCRKIYDPINAAWTVRDHEELEKVRSGDDITYDMIIFDSFMPDSIYFTGK